MGWGTKDGVQHVRKPTNDPEPTGFKRQTLDRPAAEGDDPRDLCPKGPSGWLCTRKPGHEGPCAAVRTTTTE